MFPPLATSTPCSTGTRGAQAVIKPQVDAMIGSFFGELDLLASDDDLLFDDEPSERTIRNTLCSATSKLRRLRLSSGEGNASNTFTLTATDVKLVKRIKDEEEPMVIVPAKRLKTRSIFLRDRDDESRTRSPTPGRTIRKITRQLPMKLSMYGASSSTSLASFTLEEGEIRDSLFKAKPAHNVDIDYEGLPQERPKLQSKPVARRVAQGGEKQGAQMPACFTRYNSSHYHKYITVVLYCPRGCDDRIFETKAELDDHLEKYHGVRADLCPNEQPGINCNETIAHPMAVPDLLCFKCGLTFDCTLRLEIHNTFNHAQGFFACANLYCRFRSNTRKRVIEHYDTTHQKLYCIRYKTVLQKCPEADCPAWFAFKKELNHHMWWHHRLHPHMCLVENCGRSYDERSELEYHISLRHGHFARFYCSAERCKHVSRNHEQLRKHTLMHHQRGQYVCVFGDCNFVSKYPIDVFTHYNRFHERDLRDF